MSEDESRAILEIFESKLDQIIEIIIPTQKDVAKIPAIQRDISEIKNDIKAIKAAVRSTNEEIESHDERIVVLESKTT